jgi:hypothetical protein
LLSYLLGDRVNLVCVRKDHAVGIREEYHAFRTRAVWVMGTVPALLYAGMSRADAVAAEPHRRGAGVFGDRVTLTPALLTGG